MWMMGYNDGGELYSPNDSFGGSRKLRPLIPRPPPPHAPPLSNSPNHGGGATNSSSHHPHHHHSHNHPCSGCVHNADHLFSLNHHLATMAEQSKREFNAQQVVVSSRWNPTPEQLQTLEELYRRGTRTPSAEQIQQITSQLRRYGKIEGKNVFYWFQNHKARERQKRRRQMESGGNAGGGNLPEEHNNHGTHCEMENLERIEAGGTSKTAACEVQGGANTNITTTTTITTSNNNSNWESAGAIEKEGKAGGAASASSSAVAEAAAAAAAASVTSLWMKLNEREFLLHSPPSSSSSPRTSNSNINNSTSSRDNGPAVGRNATWQYVMRSPPCSRTLPPPPPLLPPPHLCPNNHTLIMMAQAEMVSRSSSPPPSPSRTKGEDSYQEDFQTLQLFPLHSCGNEDEEEEEDFDEEQSYDRESEVDFACATHGDDHHHQFFEFLPLKDN